MLLSIGFILLAFLLVVIAIIVESAKVAMVAGVVAFFSLLQAFLADEVFDDDNPRTRKDFWSLLR